MIFVLASAVGAGAEKPPEGLSAPEWRQITSAIQLEQGRRTAEVGSKGTDSLYALDQKLGRFDPEGLAKLARVAESEADAIEAVLTRWRSASAELSELTAELIRHEGAAASSLIAIKEDLSTVKEELVAGVEFLTGLAEEDDKK